MQYDSEIFISYAHIDNEPLAQGQKGWVQLLDERLRKRVAQLLGEPAKVWRDPKLRGNDEFADVLVNSVSRAALLVSILSPRYLKSEWCLRELTEFCRHAAVEGSRTPVAGSRVFKVVKTFIPRGRHPTPLHGMLGYEFYEYDEASGRAREFSPDIDPNRDPRYWDKLEDLAWDIKESLEGLHASNIEPSTRQASQDAMAGCASGNSPVNSSADTIYVAQTTSDLNELRDRIRRELRQCGYQVLPNKELPLQAPAIQEAVRQYLKQCRLAVHLIGEYYGIIPEMDSERSIVCLQQELAIERGDDAGFSRLIWMPPGLEPKDERQRKFIVDLQNSFTSHNGPELLEVKLEDLKTIIQNKLTRKPKLLAAEREAAGPA